MPNPPKVQAVGTITPYYDRDGIRLFCGDNVAVLKSFDDGCIDLTVTSPPYDNLRTYGGHDWGWDEFTLLATELFRVTKQGGVVVWIVNDETIDGSETGTSFRQALHFKDCGFRLHDTMIYHKPQLKFPRHGHRKYCGAWEYMFVLSKGSPATFNPIRDQDNSTAGEMISNTRVRQTDGTQKDSHSNGRTISDKGTRNNVWPYTTGHRHSAEETYAHDHPAVFPEALARDHILSWSNEGDTVLDCFNGSGTTTKMAKHMARKGIGIEINAEYCKIAVNRLKQGVLDFGVNE